MALTLESPRVLNLTATGRHDGFCMPKEDSGLFSRGIWFNDDPLGHFMPIVMFQLSLFFAFTYSVYFIFRPLKLPKVVCEVVAGMIMGPTGLGRYEYFAVRFQSPRHFHLMNTLASIGLLYYVFITAVKVDIRMFTRMGKTERRIGASCLIAPFVVMLTLIMVLRSVLPDELPKGPVLLLLAASTSDSAFVNLVPVLEENNLLSTDLAQIAMSASILNESFMWVLWAVVMISRQQTMLNCITAAAMFSVLLSLVVFVGRPAMIRIVHRTPLGDPVKDFYIVIMMLSVMIMGFLSDAICGTPLIGTMVLGLVTPDGPPLGSTLTQRIEMILKTCFLPFLFLVVGAAADLSSFPTEWKQFMVFQFVILSCYLAKLLGAMLPSLLSGMSPRHALIVGLMLSTKGVMEFVSYRAMIMRKFTSIAMFTQLLCSATTLTAIVAPLAKALCSAPDKSDDKSQGGHGLTVQSTLLTPEFRILTCIHSENDVPGIIDLLEASKQTKSSPICLYMIHLMELVGRNVPSLTEHLKHSSNCKHNGCVRIMSAFNNYFMDSEGEVTIKLFSMVAFYRSMHEGICRLARDKKVPLIIVPFSARNQSHVEACIHSCKLNSNVQAYARCTIGILVDRAIHTYRGHDFFSYHVAVIFVGGQDDREALALASRMSRHHGVTITLLRVIIHHERLHSKKEREMDKTAVDDFRTKNFSNEQLLYEEIRTDDWDHTIRFTRSLDDPYDLIIVGKQQNVSGLQDDAMATLVENLELGMIGDVLVSSDSCSSKASVLVMQHHNSANPNVLGNSIRVDGSKMSSSD
ncbi:hypothetical protein Droror1_Dr00022877 [Drosera rotundifolia]